MPAKKAKKSVKKATLVEAPMPVAATTPMPKLVLPSFKMSPKILASALILIGVGLLTYKAGPWLIPAVIDKTPVTRWQVYEKLEKTYGAQVLDDMINEKVLDIALAKAGVKVDDAKLNEQITLIEKQFEATGGLDAALESRGMDRDELKKQVSTQLAVEEILKDKIAPTEDEVKAYFDENKETLYKDQVFETVSAEVAETLKQTKLREAFMTWFAEVKKDIKVKNFSGTSPVAVTE